MKIRQNKMLEKGKIVTIMDSAVDGEQSWK